MSDLSDYASPVMPLLGSPLPAGGAPARHFGFLTLPGFSMIAFTSAVEALRMANYVARRELYRWTVYSADGEPAAASNGIAARPTHRLDPGAAWPDVLIVCGGVRMREAVDAPTRAVLRRAAAHGVTLGGICTGAYALMAAGLLDGYRCATHWEQLAALHGEFPAVRFANELFVVDRDRLTCTGGAAPLDLMLHLMREQFGAELAAAVSAQFVLQQVRDAHHPQPVPVGSRVGFSRTELVEAVRLMEANVEEPLPLPELARLIGMSERNMQRMFRHYLDIAPTQYYVGTRLKRARSMLRGTDLSIARVTALCGFQSACHFSKAYRTLFGHAPSHERRAAPSPTPIPLAA